MSKISIIIPTWCEAERIGQAVEAAGRIGEEVIVADAASPDATAELASACGARVVTAPKSRGLQLRAGAEVATGDVLLFLHADARLAPEARQAMLRVLSDPRIMGGNFLLVFEGETVFARTFSIANDLRRRFLRVYYGDSGIFVRRDAYEDLNGFKPYPIFEDYEFARRLERYGSTAYVREVSIRVSARRFETKPLNALARWTLLHALYSFGNVPPERLSALYPHVR